jgi:hypothetical protein
LLSVEHLAEPVEAGLPEASIVGDPRIELTERLRTKRIEALGPLRANLDEARFVQDAEVPRDARLVDVDRVDDIVYRLLAAPEHFYDPTPRAVGQGLEDVDMHVCAYAYRCIWSLSRAGQERHDHIPPPTVSVYNTRRHRWANIPDLDAED